MSPGNFIIGKKFLLEGTAINVAAAAHWPKIAPYSNQNIFRLKTCPKGVLTVGKIWILIFFPSSNFAYLWKMAIEVVCFCFFLFYKIWFYTTGYIRLWSNNIGCFGIWQISYCKIVLIKAWTIHVFAANIGQKMSTLFWSRFYLFIYDDFGHSTWGPRLPPH